MRRKRSPKGIRICDERLKEETVVSLRKLLKHYYSDESKRQAEDWLDLSGDLSGSESESDYSIMSLIDLCHYLGDQGELEKRLVLVLLRKSILIAQVLRIQ
jgi:hypothetical protein